MLWMVLALAVSEPKERSYFADLCRQPTPACQMYIMGFIAAMTATKDVCFPVAPAKVGLDPIRVAVLQALDRDASNPNKQTWDIIARMYPCTRKE